MTEPLGLYFHIPFCRSRCRYCGFYSTAAAPGDRFVTALLMEMERYGRDMEGRLVDTVYLGGGTPSLLSESQLARIMGGVFRYFHVADGAEITMEMNPCDMTDAYLYHAGTLGINRLSVGVQAKQDRLLSAIGRLHSADEAERAVRRAFRMGFHNISADLMYELPGQSISDFETSLRWAMHLPITHLSVYSLILEEGTPFFQMDAEGRLPRPSEKESWAMYQAMCRIPRHYGFTRYEISSFARNGFVSRHNCKYWQLAPYIGMGPAACSRMGRKRWKNLPGTRRYERALLMGEPAPGDVEALTEAEEMEEYCFLNLRMAEGIRLSEFQKRYGSALDVWYGEETAELLERGLLKEDGGRLFLTSRGMALGNYVFEKFLRT